MTLTTFLAIVGVCFCEFVVAVLVGKSIALGDKQRAGLDETE